MVTLLTLLGLLGGCAGTDEKVEDDTGTSPTAASGLVLVGDDGVETDLTATAAAGASGAPIAITIDKTGELRVASGTWYVNLTIAANDVRILGVPEDEPAILSGGGTGVVVDVPTDVGSLHVENVQLNDGFGCLGQAVRAASLTACSQEAVTAVPIALTLVSVEAHNNVFDIGGGAIGISTGATLEVVDSILSGNTGHGIYSMQGDVVCRGSTDNHAGSWGNEKNGVWMQVFDGSVHTIESDGCDFGEDAEDNGHDDVGVNEDFAADYGDDVSFLCSSATNACE